jgi:hypothetical protein
VTAIRALAAAALALLLCSPAGAEPIEFAAAPIALNPGEPQADRIGKLVWLGGVHLTSPDPRFGGYSGLETIPGGRLAAVSDLGHWLVFRPVLDAAGRLIGAGEGEIEPLKDERARAFHGKRSSDAEALRRDPAQGGFLVAFERDHRVLRYRILGGPGIPIALPEDFKSQPDNGGVESLAAWPDGRVLLISEQARNADGDFKAWLLLGNAWHALGYAVGGEYLPTDSAALPGGDLVVLERRFGVLTPLGARLVRVPGQRVKPGGRLYGEVLAEWGAPYSVDNMEGLAVARAADGGVLLWLISDDNKSPAQRTLLMLFKLE